MYVYICIYILMFTYTYVYIYVCGCVYITEQNHRATRTDRIVLFSPTPCTFTQIYSCMQRYFQADKYTHAADVM